MPLTRKIILSDGDPAFVEACQECFRLLGIEVIPAAKHGLELWEAILREKPDGVICNIFMAYCDSAALLEWLNREYEHPIPLFAALSTLDNEQTFQRFLAAGGSAVFIKPLDVQQMAERMARLLQDRDRLQKTTRLDFRAPINSPLRRVTDTLGALGVPAHLMGYQCLKTALLLLMEDPRRYGARGKLYTAVANRMNASYHQVERNIRTAIRAAACQQGRGLFSQLFGSHALRGWEYPSNSCFIATVYERLLSQREPLGMDS